MALSWWLLLRETRAQLRMLEQQESELRSDYQDKRARAANLEPLKRQLAQLRGRLRQLLRQLPGKTDIPNLIVDISQRASTAGLTSELFQPGEETPRLFYVEQPIMLRMVGSYQQFGAFVSGIVSLPQVVPMTMHDIAIRARDPASAITSDTQTLEFTGTIKTYHSVDASETAPWAANAGFTRRSRRADPAAQAQR